MTTPNDSNPKRQRDRTGASVEGKHPIPSRAARKLILPRAYLRAQDRSRGALPQARTHDCVRTVNLTPTPNPERAANPRIPQPPQPPNETRKRQRDRAGASIGSDQTLPSRAARKLILPRAYLRAQDRSRGALPDNPTKLSANSVGTAEAL